MVKRSLVASRRPRFRAVVAVAAKAASRTWRTMVNSARRQQSEGQTTDKSGKRDEVPESKTGQ